MHANRLMQNVYRKKFSAFTIYEIFANAQEVQRCYNARFQHVFGHAATSAD